MSCSQITLLDEQDKVVHTISQSLTVNLKHDKIEDQTYEIEVEKKVGRKINFTIDDLSPSGRKIAVVNVWAETEETDERQFGT